MQGAHPGDPPDELHAAALLLCHPPTASQRDRVSVGGPCVSPTPPAARPALLPTGHPQREAVPGLSRLQGLHTKTSPSSSLSLGLCPVPWVGGKANPNSPGGLGTLTPGEPAAKCSAPGRWQRRGSAGNPPAYCGFVSPGDMKHHGDVLWQPGAAGRAEAVIGVLFIKGSSFKGNQSTAMGNLSLTETGSKLPAAWRKPVLGKAIPPGIKSISRLIKEIVSHAPTCGPLRCQLRALSRTSFATSLMVSKVTGHCGLCSLLGHLR